MQQDIPIIFLSGMAADEWLFESQMEAFPNLRVQRWVPPLPGESLQAYATRLAKIVDPGRPCVVGGASFGGVVALEMATHLPALGCILIGSIRSPAGLPWQWRLLKPLAVLGPEVMRKLCRLAANLGRPFLSKSAQQHLRRLTEPKAAFVRWAMCALVRWRPSPATRRIRTFHIHGESDDVLPVTLAKPDVIVPGGWHALSYFSPIEVNKFVADAVKELVPKDAP